MADTSKKQAKKKKAARKKRTGHFTGFVFWICLILLVTPPAILGWILYSSQLDSGKPVLGNRYEGDLDPAITLEQIDQINTQVNALEGVEKAWVQMPTATLRVYADINDDADSDAAREKSDAIYEIVTGVLDPAVYFTQADGKKMYDLEIHVYNHPKSENAEEDDGFVYVIKNKSSSMSDPRTQVVSVPVDSELAQQLRDETAERIAAEEAAKAEAEAAAKAEAEGGESEEAPAEEEPAEESEEE